MRLRQAALQPQRAIPAVETYQTEGMVFSLLSHIPANDLDLVTANETDDTESDGRFPRNGMDLGTDVETIEDFRNATMHTMGVDLPCDIWDATVLRTKSGCRRRYS